MWKYLSTGAPAFRNFRLVAPDWRGWKQRFTSGKGQNRSRWICIYVWCIAERGGKGEERASWARSERFSLAFHGMRSCFKILVNLASLSPCTHTYIYIYIYSIYVYRPPYISCRLSFRQCQSRRNRLFPSLPPFLPFLFPSLAPFVLVNNAIYIYSTENIRWLTFLPLLPFPISSFFSLLLLFLFFFSPLSPLRFTQSRRRVLPSMAEKCFHRPPGIIWHSFESLFSGAAAPLLGSRCICRGATILSSSPLSKTDESHSHLFSQGTKGQGETSLLGYIFLFMITCWNQAHGCREEN